MKYRIWDIDENKYVTEYAFVDCDGNVMGYCASGNWEYNHHKTIIELSTGLLDINGVEVYENHLVELDKAKAIIQFDGARFYFEVIDEDEWCCDWEIEDLDRMKILGNTNEKNIILDKER